MFLKTRFSILAVMSLAVFMVSYVAFKTFLAAFSTGLLGFLFFLPLSLGIATLAVKIFKKMKLVFTTQ